MGKKSKILMSKKMGKIEKILEKYLDLEDARGWGSLVAELEDYVEDQREKVYAERDYDYTRVNRYEP